MVVSILRGLLIVFGGVYAIIFGRDYSIAAKAKKLEENISVAKSAIIGFITNLFDTLGIGSFATSIA